MVRGSTTPAEFSGRPDATVQHEWIEAGKNRLRELLGDAHDPRVIAPPNHAYDAATLEALAALGFDIISAGHRTSRSARAVYRLGRATGRVDIAGRAMSRHPGVGPAGLRELSVSVNVDMDQAGSRVTRDNADLVGQFEQATAVGPVVGVMLHHQCWVESERDATTAALVEFLDHLRSLNGCRLLTIEEIADEPHRVSSASDGSS